MVNEKTEMQAILNTAAAVPRIDDGSRFSTLASSLVIPAR
jgi:hypothetical protein